MCDAFWTIVLSYAVVYAFSSPFAGVALVHYICMHTSFVQHEHRWQQQQQQQQQQRRRRRQRVPRAHSTPHVTVGSHCHQGSNLTQTTFRFTPIIACPFFSITSTNTASSSHNTCLLPSIRRSFATSLARIPLLSSIHCHCISTVTLPLQPTPATTTGTPQSQRRCTWGCLVSRSLVTRD